MANVEYTAAGYKQNYKHIMNSDGVQRLLEACGLEFARQCNAKCEHASYKHKMYDCTGAKLGEQKAAVFVKTCNPYAVRDNQKNRTLAKVRASMKGKVSDIHGIT